MESIAERLKQARVARGYERPMDAVRAFGWTQSTYYDHERGDRLPEKDAIEKYAAAYSVTPAWLTFGEGRPPILSTTRNRSEISAPVPLPGESEYRMPILGTANGGSDGAFIFEGGAVEYVRTPDTLVGVANAYGVYVIGESMSPRFRPGELVEVHPHRPPRRGNDVVIELLPEAEGEPAEGYIKEYVTRTPTMLVLLQHNPKKEIEIPLKRVKSIHVVVGHKPAL